MLPGGGQDTIYTSYTVQPLFAGDGEVAGLVFFALDVTEQVQARQRVEAARTEAVLANRSKDRGCGPKRFILADRKPMWRRNLERFCFHKATFPDPPA